MNFKNMHSIAKISGVALMACTLALTGCDVDELLQVDDPELLPPSGLENPSLLPALINGAYREFVVAYSGSGGDSFVSTTGLMSDELFSTGTFTTRTVTDRRDQFTPQQGNGTDGIYINLHQARRRLVDAAGRIEQFSSAGDPRLGEVKALEGFTYVSLGEAFCSNVPYSDPDPAGGLAFEFGEPQTSAQSMEAAIQRFDAAIANGGSANLAAIGKGRALLALERYGEAAAAVSTVPTTYVYLLTHSEEGDENGIWNLQDNGRYSQSSREGGNNTGVDFRSGDPRAPFFDDGVGFDPSFALFRSLRYTARTSPLALASGVEARLIEAEAALNAGNPDGMVDILNDLRSQVGTLMPIIAPPTASLTLGTLPDLTVPATLEEQQDMLFDERAFWLYLTGHRLGDLRRLVANYDRDQASVYPSGAYHKGGQHGNDVVFPLDFDEANNPFFDHADCNVESASFN